MLTPRYQVLLISILLLIAYYPSLTTEVNLVDDLSLIDGLARQQGWGVRELFLPKSSGGLYYRPLQGLSFIVDRHVWKLTTEIMHFENILLHLLNTLLVYQLCRYLLTQQERSWSYFPFLTTLLFGLHPIAVEPVNWLSGRADVMAGTFVLTAAVLLFSSMNSHRILKLALSFACLAAAFLCKESALGFVLGVVAAASLQLFVGRDRSNIFRYAVTILILIGAAGTFFLLRSHAFVSNGSRIGLTLQHIVNNPSNSILICLRSLGFYLKKIIWPFPLNFTILEVDPLFELVAIPLLLLFVVIVIKNRVGISLFIIGLGLMAPAVLIAFGQIAWTPFAERYLYLPSAFIVVALSYGFWNILVTEPECSSSRIRNCAGIYGKWMIKIGTSFLVIICFVGTLHRLVVCQTNLGLYRDTSLKNPESKDARCNYGIALYMKDDFLGAEREFSIARSLYDNRYDERYDICYAVVLARLKRWDEAAATIEHVLRMNKGRSLKAYENGIDMYREQYGVTDDVSKRNEIRQKIRHYSNKLATETNDPSVMYSLAKTALYLGEQRDAKVYFEKALKHQSDDDYLRGVTEKYLKGFKLTNVTS